MTNAAGAVARSDRGVAGRHRATSLLLCLLLCSAPLAAQEPVAAVPDWASWGTALVNPTAAVVQAIRGDDTKCELGQIVVSETIVNVSAFTVQHFLVSPRPCLGCAPHGMPSAHAANSVIGVSRGWRFGVYFAVGTAGLRTEAHRHTPWQVAAGLALGGLSEWAGHAIVRCGG